VTNGGDQQEPRPWETVLQLAGALSGLAGLVYFTGAAALWVRAWLLGLPADVAIAHDPRATVISSGVRGILAVALWFAVLTAVAAAVTSVLHHYDRRRPRAGYGAYVHGLARWLSPKGAQIAVVDAALIVGAAAISWRVFALVIGTIAAFGGAIRWLDDSKTGRGKWLGTFGLVFAAFVTGLGYQITHRVPLRAVLVSPRVDGITQAAPYFGETADFIYLGVLEKTPDGYDYLPRIREVSRADHLLTFTGQPVHYCISTPPPLVMAVRFLAGQTNTSDLSC
jgi:hypothetical protein